MGKNENPVRMCSGCMVRRPKEELIRIVRIDKNVFVDFSKKANGRGVYVCPRCDCIEKAKKKKWFQRSLKCEVSNDIYDELIKLADGE